MARRLRFTRRDVAKAGALFGLAVAGPGFGRDTMLTRRIPSSDEALPIIGLGTYSVFDVSGSREEIETRRAIVGALIDAGGSVIDSSPMYNRSEKIIGDVLDAGGNRPSCFLATKVWTDGRAAGERQMRRSAELMRTDRIDLMQVHNRRDMEAHWPTIEALKADGFVRYNGVTDYRESASDAMIAIMRRYRPEFIQINYSLGERGAENALLPAARDMGIAVLINRPFMAGRLFRAVGDRPLPGWAAEFCDSWGQFFLKFIVSHPAVTCAIPATSRVEHMRENMGALGGRLPDAKTRARMIRHIESL